MSEKLKLKGAPAELDGRGFPAELPPFSRRCAADLFFLFFLDSFSHFVLLGKHKGN
jgi:hypothetical protein